MSAKARAWSQLGSEPYLGGMGTEPHDGAKGGDGADVDDNRELRRGCRSALVVIPTGGGKTAVFYGLLPILEALRMQPVWGVGRIPSKPAVIMVTPLNELGIMQAAEMQARGIEAVAVNAQTIAQTRLEGRDLVDEVRLCRWRVSIWSPEKLVSQGSNSVFDDEDFRKNVIAYGVDEVHVVPEWGNAFRDAYRHIGSLRNRLPSRVPVIALTATLTPGPEQASVCKVLGLHRNQYHFERHSCERANVQLTVNELSHGLTGYSFPDIAWTILGAEKVVIYCKTIDLGFRVAVYLWSLCTNGQDKRKTVRVWNSLKFVVAAAG
ncbi:hypothetical protein CONPUDRAFT_159494 [Coniophora puteana RWD-64-598 SS2]|uniref:DNA 3'-5' helicase n=1 Tax=Coniophora puteana (strain RWD-64-598) TaxID=741705 RepID=A0A5M3M9N5_CONPW|nr:uncharacterized protein CONPUDRAFT_159494 [Coniophora puteana RWD-64-598 SS2]EIW75371.1 hypothetical protein CONPUDRAFT_159494 [Coniophora puteana RWD-64-598 SS2]